MKKSIFWHLMITWLSVLTCTLPAAAFSPSLSIQGSQTCYEQAIVPFQGELRQATSSVLEIRPTCSQEGLEALISGKIDVAMVSGDPQNLIDQLKRDGHSFRKKNLLLLPLGTTPLSVIVHESNPVEHLSPEQAQAIFQGKITNWAEVGGVDAPITVLSECASGGASHHVSHQMIEDPAHRISVKRLGFIPLQVRLQPYAIGYAPEHLLRHQPLLKEVCRFEKNHAIPLYWVTLRSSSHKREIIMLAHQLAQHLHKASKDSALLPIK